MKYKIHSTPFHSQSNFKITLFIVETVFPGCEFLGWYSNSQLQEDLSIHKQIMAFNENPIYLLLESLTVSSAKELPIKIFDSEIRVSKIILLFKELFDNNNEIMKDCR